MISYLTRHYMLHYILFFYSLTTTKRKTLHTYLDLVLLARCETNWIIKSRKTKAAGKEIKYSAVY